jgi:hypothetical protein
MVPLSKAIDLVLEGADITDENKGLAKINFLEAFEEGQPRLTLRSYSELNVNSLLLSTRKSLKLDYFALQ